MISLEMSGPQQVRLVERDTPIPGAGEILVRVRVAGVCRSDVETFWGRSDLAWPHYPGHESAGIVEAVGDDVERFVPGDNVAVLGDHLMAEYALVPVNRAAHLPAEIDDWSSWVVEPAACAANAVDIARVRADDVVGVVGCGYMGLLVLRFLAITHARAVIALDVSDAALEAAAQSGATHTVRAQDAGDAIASITSPRSFSRPMEASYEIPTWRGGAFDIVFENSGTEAGLQTATKLIRVGGTIVIFGHHRGTLHADGTAWHMKGIHVVNATPMAAADFGQMFQRTAGLLRYGRVSLDGLVTHTAPAAEAQAVFEASQSAGYVKASLTF